MTPVLELRSVSAAYGPFRALFDVSLTVDRGESVALVGSNGAGKTTVARVASGLVVPSAGAVIVDLAAETGGNCELTRAGETTVHNGVSVIGATNLPSSVPHHASLMFSKNVFTLLQHLIKDGNITLNLEDEITGPMCLVHAGAVRA